MSTTARVELIGGHVVLISPCNEELPDRARQLGGKWDASERRWKFDARDEARVR